jgi:ACS family D-galactonate transporter-like MFS transporter
MGRRRWVILALVFLGIVISYIDRGNLSIAAPSMMRDFGLAPGAMGVLLSAFFWTYSAFQIPAGAFVDRFGIRTSYAGAFVAWSLASAAMALSRGGRDVIGLRMLLGIAESIGPLASISFIRNNYEGKDQGFPTSVYIAGQNTGPAVGAIIGAFLVDQFGWRMMFAATGLGALTWLPGWLAAVPPDENRSALPGGREVEDSVVGGRWTWRMLATSKTVWAMALATFLAAYYWYFVLTWIPSYLIFARGFSTLEMGRIVSIALFTMAVANILAGLVVDNLAARIGVFRARVLFAVSGYAGTAVILLVLITDRSWTLPILTLSMCATGIGNSNYWAISQHVPPKNMVGRTIGFLNTISCTGGIVAPVITGLILGPTKQFGPAILIAGVCPALAAVCLLVAGPTGLERMKSLLAGESLADA